MRRITFRQRNAPAADPSNWGLLAHGHRSCLTVSPSLVAPVSRPPAPPVSFSATLQEKAVGGFPHSYHGTLQCVTSSTRRSTSGSSVPVVDKFIELAQQDDAARLLTAS